MKRKHQSGSIKVLVILLLGVLLTGLIYWLRPSPKIRPPVTPQLPQVSVIQAQLERYQVSVQTQGTVIPSRSINLVAEVSGRVVEVTGHFSNGEFFNQGDVLVRLDDRDYRYQLIEAQAQVAAAKRELAFERGQARQAKREWRDLGSKEANDLFLRNPQVNAANAQLAASVARQQQIQLDVERTSIKAPFTGRIQSTHVDLGQYVMAGSTVASIFDSTLAEVRLPLTNQQLALIGLPLGGRLSADQQIDVTLSANIAGQVYQWPAKLVRTEASIDTQTRLYFAVVEVPFPFDAQRYQAPLMMGLFVEAQVAGLFFDDVIRVPEKAIINNQWLLIVDGNQQLQRRAVKVVSKNSGQVWVSSEIEEGQAIVVSDPNILYEGMEVSTHIQSLDP